MQKAEWIFVPPSRTYSKLLLSLFLSVSSSFVILFFPVSLSFLVLSVPLSYNASEGNI